MAILRAFRAFDMRIIVREDGDTETDGGDIEIADGVWRTSFTGDFQATPTGYTGTLTGFGGGLPLKQALLALERGARVGQNEMFAPERSNTAARRR